jgi:thiamine-phosphate pyrophosphorylase
VLNKIKLFCQPRPGEKLSIEEQAEQACSGGADAILFDPGMLSAKEMLALGQRLREVCSRAKALFVVGGRADIALTLDADGVHLSQDDLPVEWAHRILGPRKIVGVSVSSLGQAAAAIEQGADYVAIGPLFPAAAEASKDIPGIDSVRLVKKRIKVPLIAFGGITRETAAEVIRTGADGVLVGQAIMAAQDISSAAREFKQIVVAAEKERF